jgi:hypothetical protein
MSIARVSRAGKPCHWSPNSLVMRGVGKILKHKTGIMWKIYVICDLFLWISSRNVPFAKSTLKIDRRFPGRLTRVSLGRDMEGWQLQECVDCAIYALHYFKEEQEVARFRQSLPRASHPGTSSSGSHSGRTWPRHPDIRSLLNWLSSRCYLQISGTRSRIHSRGRGRI